MKTNEIINWKKFSTDLGYRCFMLKRRKLVKGINDCAKQAQISGNTLNDILNRARATTADSFIKLCVWMRVDPSDYLIQETFDSIYKTHEGD